MVELATHLRTMATYNGWANRRLYAAAATLPDAAYRQTAGAYFGSLHGTLNHLLVADRIWLRRLTGVGDAPDRMDAILADRLEELRLVCEAENARVQAYVSSLSAVELDASFDYATTSGARQCQPRWTALVHLFNHQTHHRGQAHAILTRLGMEDPPPLDLLIMQREQAGRAAA